MIVHKDIIGNEGKIQVSRVSIDGKTTWTFNSGLKEWSDWLITENQFFIFGTDNKALSSGEVNVVWRLDLSTGTSVKYDYFTDK